MSVSECVWRGVGCGLPVPVGERPVGHPVPSVRAWWVLAAPDSPSCTVRPPVRHRPSLGDQCVPDPERRDAELGRRRDWSPGHRVQSRRSPLGRSAGLSVCQKACVLWAPHSLGNRGRLAPPQSPHPTSAPGAPVGTWACGPGSPQRLWLDPGRIWLPLPRPCPSTPPLSSVVFHPPEGLELPWGLWQKTEFKCLVSLERSFWNSSRAEGETYFRAW